MPSKVDFVASEARLDPGTKLNSMHDKMAQMMFKTLNYIEEEHPNKNHRVPSMADVRWRSFLISVD